MMDIEKRTIERVQGALYHLRRGLTPFVEAHMKRRHGAKWLHYASRAAGGGPNDALDAYGLLKTILDNWVEIFSEAFPRQHRHTMRSAVSMALDARNAVSHLALGLPDEEALRYLSVIHQVLKLAKADEDEVAAVKTLFDEQRVEGVAPAPSVSPEAVAPAAVEPETKSGRGLRPWIEAALPHPDVLQNRFKESEFAADLFAVDAGHVEGDYADPMAFYRMTFLTEGLRRVLASAAARLAGKGGDPVIGLQTSFGGGKTHTLLAVYHLARHLAAGLDPTELVGMESIVKGLGEVAWQKPRFAVFVGSAEGPDVSLRLQDGPTVRTLWGYLAWRIGGEAGLKLVAEAEEARTNPGSALMVEVFRLGAPCVILLDELVMFARQLDDVRFEAFLSFVQSLTEAAKIVPGVLIVGSLPESSVEAGGEKGRDALLRLETVFGRVQSPWLPATGDETYEIVRRRLFQELDAEGTKARDATVKAFVELYKKNASEFPSQAKEARYAELLRLCYPIHPELFDRLSKDWASLPKFQRTRGVLRFMANVIGVLWHDRVNDPLILPGRVPIGNERVRASVLYPLDPAFGAVVDKEVDGDGALPARLEANPSSRIGQARAATRAARAVFLGSAPLADQRNAGLTRQDLRLACAEPGDQLAIFGEAVRDLAERATYLYEEAGRYWFSTHPTLNQEAERRAKSLAEHQVDEAVVEMLKADGATKGGFHRVFAVPDEPSSVDEAEALSLMILGPATPHAGKTAADSKATEAVAEVLTRCRSTQRRYRNTLLFVAADEAQLATAREAMRRALAWESIGDDPTRNRNVDKDLQGQLTQTQLADARDKASKSREGAVNAIRAAWSHVLYPDKTEATQAGRPFDLEHLAASNRDRASVPKVVYEKARSDGIIKEKLGAEVLWRHLEPLWPVDRPHLPVAEISEWFRTYVYLPKLRDTVVLETALAEACGKLEPAFAFAGGVDAATGRYEGLTWQRVPEQTAIPSGLLVRPDAAIEQLRQETNAAAPAEPASSGGEAEGTTPPAPPGAEPGPAPKTQPTRFYGSVEIDMVRPMKAFEQILNAVVTELQRTNGAKVTLSLEIEATAADGFADGDIGVVRDNARQLKFRSESTGFE